MSEKKKEIIDKGSTVEPLGLKYIPTSDILPNPHNPRMFFPEDTLAILLESINKVGILVPLLVYKDKRGRFVILDGERRWRCARKLGLPDVPVNIISEPDTVTNLLTMFNIHNIREPWQVMPAALKLEVIMRQLKTRNERKLADLTGLSVGSIRRLKHLLSYPKRYQDMMLKSDAEESGITADFFTELYPVLRALEKHIPEAHLKLGQNVIIERLLEKYRKKIVSAAREFRTLARIIRAVSRGVSKSTVMRAFESVVMKPDFTIEAAYDMTVRDTYETENLKRQCGNLLRILSSEHVRYEDATAMNVLRKLRRKIDEILLKSGSS